jgi:hypothetical protein
VKDVRPEQDGLGRQPNKRVEWPEGSPPAILSYIVLSLLALRWRGKPR